VTGLGALVAAAVVTACAGYLLLRLAVFVWGYPDLPDRVFGAFELRRRGATLGIVDAVICGAILFVLEVAAVVTVSDAFASSDYFTAVVFTVQFVAAVGWVGFLRSRTSTR
jgi:hypothetical protein